MSVVHVASACLSALCAIAVVHGLAACTGAHVCAVPVCKWISVAGTLSQALCRLSWLRFADPSILPEGCLLLISKPNSLLAP